MGGGAWDAAAYSSRVTRKAASGTPTFAYSSTTHTTPATEWRVSDRLDPKKVAGPGSPHEGKVMRESRDSDEHPESVAIAVVFDVTGSMGQIPEVLQQKLPKLHGLLQRKGYVEHPQILFGAVGDATSGDRVPLQVGQFESDNNMDLDLEDIFLEGGGGGGNHESYALAAYYLWKHTSTDCWEKRGKRGYAFLIGDERAYRTVPAAEIRNLIGGGAEESVSTVDVIAGLRETYDVYYLFARQGSYQPEQVVASGADDSVAHAWSDLLGQNAILLDDADAVCETIALAVGIGEGMIDIEEGLDHLRELGTDESTVEATGKALAEVGAGSGKAIAAADGDLDTEGDAGVEAI